MAFILRDGRVPLKIHNTSGEKNVIYSYNIIRYYPDRVAGKSFDGLLSPRRPKLYLCLTSETSGNALPEVFHFWACSGSVGIEDPQPHCEQRPGRNSLAEVVVVLELSSLRVAKRRSNPAFYLTAKSRNRAL